MTRATSREAYCQLVESGAIKGKQAMALKAAIYFGPATSAEIIHGAKLGANVNLWRARFTELQARGLIVETGTRKCKITGRTALVWEATNRTKPLKASTAAGVSKKTLAATLIRMCNIVEHYAPTSDKNAHAAIEDAQRLAGRA